MSEVITPLIKLEEGQEYTAGPDNFVITEEHTISDILRFVVTGCCGHDKSEAETILRLLEV